MSVHNSTALFPREQKAIDTSVTRLHERYPDRISEILLFGSKARGDSGPESDIDILVVASTEHWRFRHAISDLASDVSLEYGVLIAPRVIAQERWERMREASYSFYHNVAREGVSLNSRR